MAKIKQKFPWKRLRVSILLVILAIVALNTWRDRNQNWSKPIYVVLYPINADQSQVSQNYINQIQLSELKEISDYLNQQAKAYTDQAIHFHFVLGQQVQNMPPAVPQTGKILDVMLWSLKFRYYAWQQQQDLAVKPSVSLFLTYYDPKQNPVLKHSTALQKGRIGIVNLFSSQKQQAQNKIVITHELLHAFGALDKYDLNTGQPIFPIGYSDPQQQPLYPQKMAEIMAVAVPVSSSESKMAHNLAQTRVNLATAQELGWAKPLRE